jgi:hypothetical protein
MPTVLNRFSSVRAARVSRRWSSHLFRSPTATSRFCRRLPVDHSAQAVCPVIAGSMRLLRGVVLWRCRVNTFTPAGCDALVH